MRTELAYGTLVGRQELERALRKCSKEAKKAVNQAVSKSGKQLKTALVSAAPVGRQSSPGHAAGTLKRSIKSKKARLSYAVWSDSKIASVPNPKGKENPYRYGRRLNYDRNMKRTYGWWTNTRNEAYPAAMAEYENTVLPAIGRAFNESPSVTPPK